jgi:hypothetical protein
MIKQHNGILKVGQEYVKEILDKCFVIIEANFLDKILTLKFK